MRWGVSLVLLLATLAGCAQVPSTHVARSAGLVAQGVAGPAGLTPVQMAERFYARVKPSFKGQMSRLDAMVVMRSEGGLETRYDFTETVRSGNVRVMVDDFRTDFPYDRLMADDPQQEVLAASLVVTIALQTAFGGARALAFYYVTHRGAAFKREDAIKVTVIGMGQALVSFAPYGRYLSALVPIVVEWLFSLKSKGDFASIAEVSVSNLDHLITVIRQMEKDALKDRQNWRPAQSRG